MRTKLTKTGGTTIRVGEHEPRSITLPVIGVLTVIEDTRRLRRLLRPGPDGTSRARIWFATASRHRGRWVITLNVEAPDLHPAMRHAKRAADHGGFVGVDRGLSAWVVAAGADGVELDRRQAPKALARALPKLRRVGRQTSRKQLGSHNRRRADARLNRIHGRIADQRRHATHEVTTGLVKTHDRICVEHLAVANLVRNRYLARPIADAAWGELSRQLAYKAARYRTELAVAPRFLPSGRSTRTWTCPSGSSAATQAPADVGWSSTATSTLRSTSPPGPRPSIARQPRPRTPKQEAGSPTPVERPALATAHAVVQLVPQPRQGRSRNRSGLPHRPPERTPEKGADERPRGLFDRL